MNPTHVSERFKVFPALRRSYRRADPAKALEDWARAEQRAVPEKAAPTGTPFAALEKATATWRYLQHWSYRRKAAIARDAARSAAKAWGSLVAIPDACVGLELARQRVAMGGVSAEEKKARGSARWYEGRAAAQPVRFATVRTCGARTLRVSCGPCGNKLCEIPCYCGVVRVCKPCADRRAQKREKRVAAARLAAVLVAGALHLEDSGRENLGVWSEKMLTLTVPHLNREDAAPGSDVHEATDRYGLRTTIATRIAALQVAWRRFIRTVRRFVIKHEGKENAAALRFYRFFEWTRGNDGEGHPHFHVYLLSPFLDQRWLAEIWATSLDAAGVGEGVPTSCVRCETKDGSEGWCPMGFGAPHVIVDIRRLYGPTSVQLRELIKRGKRSAIESRLSKLCSADQVTTYANGWTMGDAFDELGEEASIETQRDVYIALEGRRLCQGSRGFLTPPVRPVCAHCKLSDFRASVVDPCVTSDPLSSTDHDLTNEHRGPP